MKTLKKVLAVIMCVVITLTAAPLGGFVGMELPDGSGFKKIVENISSAFDSFSTKVKAAEVYSGTCGAEGDNLTWTLDTETGVLEISGMGAMADWSLAIMVPWYGYGSDIIKTINIGNNITSICRVGFGCLTNLTSITVDADNKYYSSDSYGVLFNKDKTTLVQYPIGNTRISYTIPDSVTTIGSSAFYYCTSLTSVTIPDSVTTIGDDAFCDCESLTSVTIPDSVTAISSYAFSGCDSLTSVTIPNSVITIGDGAFYRCRSLTSVTIPDSVTTIGNYAFDNCTSLTSITVDENNKNYSSDSYGVLFNKDKTTLIQYPIGNTRTSYTIPDSVTTIGDYAFADCTILTSITIPNSVISISYAAFRGCTNITTITIPDSVTTIGNWAFSDCTSLTNITNSNSIIGIGEYAFASCSSLTSITIPNSITAVGEGAFASCSNLKKVYYSGDREQWKTISIGRYNESLKNANIQYNYIGANVVDSGKCGEKLTWTLYDNGLLEITGTGAMDVHWSYPSYAPWYSKRSYIKTVNIESGVTTIGDNAFFYCDNLTSVKIADSVTRIGDNAFIACDSLTSVTIGNSVATIGVGAFTGCESLTNVTIPDSVTSIGEYAFSYCTSLTSIIIPDNVTTIGSVAFEGCASLSIITIGNSVTTIGDEAFSSCKSLTSITVASNNKYYSNDNYGVLFNKDKTILIQYPAGNTRKSYTVPDSVTTIGDYAFRRCTSLTSVTIPDSVTTIGNYAFYDCDSLTSVTIGNGVTTIGNYAFEYCTSLTSVTIPDSVTKIGDSAFDRCYSLTDVYYSGSEEQWKAISIGKYNEPLLNATIHYNYVPETDSSIIDVEISGDLPVKSGNTLTFNVTTSTGITKLRMEDSGYVVNEWTKTNAIDNGDGTLTWTVTQIINTIGENRTLDFRAGTADGYEEGVYKSPAFTCIENEQKLPSTTIEHPAMSAIFLQGDEQNLIWTVDGVPDNGLIPDYFIINVFKDNELVFAKRNIKAADYLGDDGKFFYNIDGGYFEETGEYEISVTSVKEGYQYSDDEVAVTVNQRFLPETNVIYPTSKSQIYENEVGYVHWTIGNIIPESEVHPDSFTVTVTNPSGNKTEYTKAFSDWSDGYGYDYDEGFFYFTIPGEVFATYGKYTITVTSAKEGYLPSSNSVVFKVLCPHEETNTESIVDKYPLPNDGAHHTWFKTEQTICVKCKDTLKEIRYVDREEHHTFYEELLCICGHYVKHPDFDVIKNCTLADGVTDPTLYWDAGKTVDLESKIFAGDSFDVIGYANGYYLIKFEIASKPGTYKARFIQNNSITSNQEENLYIEIYENDGDVATTDYSFPPSVTSINYYPYDNSFDSYDVSFTIYNAGDFLLKNAKLVLSSPEGISFDENDINKNSISVILNLNAGSHYTYGPDLKHKDYWNHIYAFPFEKPKNGKWTINIDLYSVEGQRLCSSQISIACNQIEKNILDWTFTDDLSFANQRIDFFGTFEKNDNQRYLISDNDFDRLLSGMGNIVKARISDIRQNKPWEGSCYGMAALVAAKKAKPDFFDFDKTSSLAIPRFSFATSSLINYYYFMQWFPDAEKAIYNGLFLFDYYPEVFWPEFINRVRRISETGTPIMVNFYGEKGHTVLALGIKKIEQKNVYIEIYDPNSYTNETLIVRRDYSGFEYGEYKRLCYFYKYNTIDLKNYYTEHSNVIDTSYSHRILEWRGLPSSGVYHSGSGKEFIISDSVVADYSSSNSENPMYKKYLSSDFNNVFMDFETNSPFDVNYIQGDYYYSISADSGSHIEMLDSGKMTFIPKKSGKFELSITTSNEKTELPWYTTTVCGTSGESVSLSTKSSEGVLFEGITEGPVHAVISNDNGDTAIEIETDAEAVLVAPQTDNTVKVLVDADENGTYESEIPCETVSVEGVSISNDTLEIERTETAYVYANVEPYYASNTNVSFVSSDPSIATVDENGCVTAVSCGTCTITVITEDGNYTDECKVTVVPKSNTINWVVDGIPTETSFREGELIVKPQNPTKEGYTFTGWTPTVPDTMPAEDLTFTAQWKVNTYTVTWVVDGAETKATYEFGKAITAPANPSKEGFEFIGWDNTVPTTMPAENLTFTAQYELLVKQLKIKTPSVKEVKYGDTLILHADIGDVELPEGWSIEWTAEGTGAKIKATEDGMKCEVTCIDKGEVNVTATIVDENGDPVLNVESDELTAQQKLTMKGGFFWKIISFFKDLFRISRIILQAE